VASHVFVCSSSVAALAAPRRSLYESPVGHKFVVIRPLPTVRRDSWARTNPKANSQKGQRRSSRLGTPPSLSAHCLVCFGTLPLEINREVQPKAVRRPSAAAHPSLPALPPILTIGDAAAQRYATISEGPSGAPCPTGVKPRRVHTSYAGMAQVPRHALSARCA
jgi:hypothetical protein